MPMRLKDDSSSHFGKKPLEEPHGQMQGYTAEYNIRGKGIIDVTATSAIIEKDFPVCQVCHHLNPDYVQCNQVTNQAWTPWAMREFKDAAAIRSCSFDISKGADLVESANKGCQYCGVLCGALTSMLPSDWETKESFLIVHVAWGLPIIINFKFGALWKGETLPKDLDPFHIFAPGIAPMNDSGSHFTIEFTPEGSEKEHILELYKPQETPASQLKGFPELRYLGSVPERFQDLDCAHSYSEMERAIEQCRSGIGAHVACRVSAGAKLPSRILYIGSLENPTVQLLTPGFSIPGVYNALSYRWGGLTFLKTKKANLAKFSKQIDWETLPPMFQDAITVSRNLRVLYLWIDSLCIVQDDKEEWAEQAPKMGAIYTNAYVTITCASASDPSARILGPRPSEWQSKTFGITDDSGVPILLRVRQKATSMATADRDTNPDHLANRAWIWQERLLSTRSLVFTNAAMKFECRTASLWEDQLHPGHSFSSFIDKDPRVHWTKLIEDFTSRNITFSTDRIFAIQAVMNTVQEKYKLTPLCGLWRETLTRSLHWSAKEGFNSLQPHSSYLAPSWSWASLEGAVHWTIGLADGLPEADKQWDLKVEGVEFPDPQNPESSPERETIILEGRFMRANIMKQAGEYFVVFAGGHASEAMKFIPDTELVPYEPVPGMEGYHYSTRRKTWGEDAPEGGWIGQCGCMLMVRTGESGTSLLISPSLYSPGYLERVGLLVHHPVAEVLKQPRRVMKIH